ncbi:hypothetical protein [Sediminibacterium soli]|uniref:hypothetical protein n=1 Tax=Sediminibacterium soli TaxID=2698829 RepID=UPI001379865D|nr:hypothetical protein [Sediminibacterium soli]NCI47176.1 hypothetical protein [Sediminibacterium soli]
MKRVAGRYKFLIFTVMILWGCRQLHAQQTQFIHLQSEGEQPFYAALGGVQYTSSLNGYLVIPELRPGEYHLLIGFPSTGKEYVFDYTIADRSRAFSMKREVDNNWTLFDMVDFSETRGLSASLWRNRQLALQKEAVRAAREQARKSGVSGGIHKIYDRASPGGVDQVYVVNNGNKKDTIALFIPALEENKPGASAYQPLQSMPRAPFFPAADAGALATDPQRNRYLAR